MSIRTATERLWKRYTRMFGTRLGVPIGATVLFLLMVAVVWLIAVFNAPPSQLVVAAGPKDSAFYRTAQRYQKILAEEGVKLVILETAGSLDNLRDLSATKHTVDVGFVQSGLGKPEDYPHIVSLGSISVQPVNLYYRIAGRAAPLEKLADFAGQRIVIGPKGTGVHYLALELLKANGIVPGGTTTLLETDDEAAAADLAAGHVDALFVMGESASVSVIQSLRKNADVRLFDFKQAEGYSRRFKYLNVLRLPRGSQDLGRDLPPQDMTLIGPSVELLARENLHPALSDLLLETARKVHAGAGTYKKRGEFPNAAQQDFPISEDAQRFYTSGKTFVYRSMPFWMARLVTAILTILIPLLVLLIPAMRIVPAIYRWTVTTRLYKLYAALIEIEQHVQVNNGAAAEKRNIKEMTPEERRALLLRLEGIEQAAAKVKVPAIFADMYYTLRSHIEFVRSRLHDVPPKSG